MLSCNSGHLGAYYFYEKGNFASALSTKVKNGVVYGYDGNVGFGWDPITIEESKYNPNNIDYKYQSRLSWNQEGYYEINIRTKSNKYVAMMTPPKGRLKYSNGRLVS